MTKTVKSMNRQLLFITLLCAVLAGRAQQVYDTFVEEGKRWNCRISHIPSEYNHDGYYLLQGDTAIDGKTCKKMYFYDEERHAAPVYQCGLYEEAKKVYAITTGEKSPFLLYDFNLRQDKWVVENGKKAIVAKVDTLYCAEVSFCAYMLLFVDPDTRTHSGGTIYLSGVGSVAGPLFATPTIDGMHEVVSCKLNDKVTIEIDASSLLDQMYKDFDIDGYLKEKVLAVETPQFTGKDVGKVFDLQGRRLAAPPAKGLYIQGGRLKIGHGLIR